MRQIKMSRIKQKRSPHRRSKKTRSQRGGLTKAEIFDTVYAETLDR